jgi:hypothetical protein
MLYVLLPSRAAAPVLSVTIRGITYLYWRGIC